MTTEIFLHEIKLPEAGPDPVFARRFNTVSELFDRATNPAHNLTEEQREAAFEDFFWAKFRLEMGIEP